MSKQATRSRDKQITIRTTARGRKIVNKLCQEKFGLPLSEVFWRLMKREMRSPENSVRNVSPGALD